MGSISSFQTLASFWKITLEIRLLHGRVILFSINLKILRGTSMRCTIFSTLKEDDQSFFDIVANDLWSLITTVPFNPLTSNCSTLVIDCVRGVLQWIDHCVYVVCSASSVRFRGELVLGSCGKLRQGHPVGYLRTLHRSIRTVNTTARNEITKLTIEQTGVTWDKLYSYIATTPSVLIKG